MADILPIAREHILLVLALSLLGTLGGLSVALTLPRPYEASARLLIDPRGLQVVDREIMPRSGAIDQNLAVLESEMRVLTSDRVLRGVVEKLKLQDDPEFTSPAGLQVAIRQAVDRFKAALPWLAQGQTEPASPPADVVALAALKRVIGVRREPLSFVVDVQARSLQAGKAMALADAVAAEYSRVRFVVQSDTMRRAAETIEGLLDGQRRRLEAAEAKASQFRSANDIVEASGRLVNEQQLAETSSRLVIAQGETAQARARNEQLERLRRTKGLAEADSAVLGSTGLVDLRNQLIALQRREASLQSSLLPSHPVYRQVLREIQSVEGLIVAELTRLADGARLVLERAQANEAAIQRSLDAQKAQALVVGAKQVELRELEREVEASRAVYAAYLARSREIGGQRQLDSTLTLVLSQAATPQNPIGLPRLIPLLAGTLAGLGLGLVAALLRDRVDPMVRSLRHVREAAGPVEITQVAGLHKAEQKSATSLGTCTRSLPLFVADQPQLPASRALRHLAEQMRRRTAGRFPVVVLVTSLAETPSRPLIAANLAVAFAALGERVLLVDSDLEYARITFALQAGEAPGLLDAITSPQAMDTLLPRETAGLSVLPIGQRHSCKVSFDPAAVAAAIAVLGRGRDVIVVDGTTMQSRQVVAAWSPNADISVVVCNRRGLRKAELAAAMAPNPARGDTHWTIMLLDRAG